MCLYRKLHKKHFLKTLQSIPAIQIPTFPILPEFFVNPTKGVLCLRWNEHSLSAYFRTLMTLLKLIVSITSGVSL